MRGTKKKGKKEGAREREKVFFNYNLRVWLQLFFFSPLRFRFVWVFAFFFSCLHHIISFFLLFWCLCCYFFLLLMRGYAYLSLSLSLRVAYLVAEEGIGVYHDAPSVQLDALGCFFFKSKQKLAPQLIFVLTFFVWLPLWWYFHRPIYLYSTSFCFHFTLS